MNQRELVAIAGALALLAACSPQRTIGQPRVDPAPPSSAAARDAGSSDAAVSVAALSAAAEAMAARRACPDTCCTGPIPEAYQRAHAGAEDTAHADALRALLDGPLPPTVHALAASWLARARDVGDLPRLARCVGSSEPAGVFPTLLPQQAALSCDHVTWSEKTLGRACIDAIGAILSRDFADEREVRAWLLAHPSPLDTGDYWQRTLGVSRPAPDALLDRLRRRSPELYVQVVGANPDFLGPTSAPEFERAAKDDVGADRLLDVLRGQAALPFLDTPDRRATFATTVLSHADAIFAPRHGPALLSLWESRACCAEPQARAALAVAVGRAVPAEGPRVLKATLSELPWGQGPVLEELGRRHSVAERATLEAWSWRPDARNDEAREELAVAVLRGLKDAGVSGRPALAAVTRAQCPGGRARPSAGASWRLVEAALEASAASGYAVPAACRGSLFPKAGKGATTAVQEQARRAAEAVTEGCLTGICRWVAVQRSR